MEKVQGDEWLYRRVRNLPENFRDERDGQGRKLPSSQAFSDRSKKISVDRAHFCENNPRYTLLDQTDVVVELLTDEVRAIHDVPCHNGQDAYRAIDVVPDPIYEHSTLPDNPAHALICATPEFAAKDEKHFKKLKQYLARLARWAYFPQ